MMTGKKITNGLMVAVVGLVLAMAPASHADLTNELGILDLTANGGINPATGVAWALGDTYRFVFLSSTGTQATNTSINYYNTFVQDLANASALNIGVDEGVTWKAIASTATVDARDNTSTHVGVDGTGESIWLLDGETLVASNNVALYSTTIKHPNGTTWFSETAGAPLDVGYYGHVWTGSTGAGTVYTADGLGAIDGTSTYGQWRANNNADHWISRGPNIPQAEVKPLYGLSEPLHVVGGATPATPGTLIYGK